MKILMIDDHALFRDGLRFVLRQLETDPEILEAASNEQALQMIEQHQDLDLVLLDLDLQGTPGLDVLKSLSECAPSVPVIIVSASDDTKDIQRSMAAGASGYIPKSSTSQVLLSALQLVFSGGIYVPPEIMKEAVEATKGTSVLTSTPQATDASFPLTLRQMEVLGLLCRGDSNKHICRTLNLAEGTVKAHVTSILKILDVGNRTKAAIKARELGIIAENTAAP